MLSAEYLEQLNCTIPDCNLVIRALTSALTMISAAVTLTTIFL